MQIFPLLSRSIHFHESIRSGIIPLFNCTGCFFKIDTTILAAQKLNIDLNQSISVVNVGKNYSKKMKIRGICELAITV